jgi:hypothetical protein
MSACALQWLATGGAYLPIGLSRTLATRANDLLFDVAQKSLFFEGALIGLGQGFLGA